MGTALGLFISGLGNHRGNRARERCCLYEGASIFQRREQGRYLIPQLDIAATGVIKKCGLLLRLALQSTAIDEWIERFDALATALATEPADYAEAVAILEQHPWAALTDTVISYPLGEPAEVVIASQQQ